MYLSAADDVYCHPENVYSEFIANNRPCILGKKDSFDSLRKIREAMEANKLLLKSATTEEESLSQEYMNKDKYSKNLLGMAKNLGEPELAETFELSSIKLEKQPKDYQTETILNNKQYIYIQISGESTVILSPITQINHLSPYRTDIDTKSRSVFNPIYSKENLFDLHSKKHKDLVLIQYKLIEGEMLYIPAYYFRQEHSNNSVKVVYEYKSNSRTLDNLFKVLFDDTFSEN